MAYVQNYAIAGSGGEITPKQAAARYPMGHGDAYGHYLSAVWGYYRLLRNPHFEWGDPSMMEMLVADSIVNMDYEDEQKFAMAAAKMAQAGADVVDLTARKTWRDQGGVTGAGYFDADGEQGFGYGEWAVRSGLGAFYNWAAVNSLVPADAASATNRFADASIKDITRETIPALRLLGEILEKGRWLCCGLTLFQVKVFSFLAVDGIYAVGVLLGDSSALALGTHRVLTCIISGLCLDAR